MQQGSAPTPAPVPSAAARALGTTGSRASAGLCVKQTAGADASPEPGTVSSLLVLEAVGGAGASVWLWLKKEFSLYVRL